MTHRSPAAAAAYREGFNAALDRYNAIAAACAGAGRPDLAMGFAEAGTSLADVHAALKELEAADSWRVAAEIAGVSGAARSPQAATGDHNWSRIVAEVASQPNGPNGPTRISAPPTGLSPAGMRRDAP